MLKSTRKVCAERLEDRTLLAADLNLLESPLPPPGGDLEQVPAEIQSADGMRTRDGDRSDGPHAPRPDDNDPPPAVIDSQYSIDGTDNNVSNSDWGSTDEQLLRTTTVEYADGISAAAGEDRPSAREVSNAIAAQTESTVNDRNLTDLLWLWGQFVDHDIDLTEGADPAESLPIEVPTGDAYFDPSGSGDVTIDFNRSTYDPDTGDSTDNPRQQINQITAYLDGSVVYGSDQERADALRTFEGGRLATSEGDLLPFNEEGLANAGGPSDTLFLAGDVRANENVALTAMQTVWVREHNRIAAQIATADPTLSDEEIYQQAKTIVVAEIQAITFNEFLPALLGVDAISDYAGYDSTVDSGIANIFSTAAYRFGHSMLSSSLLRLNSDGTTADEGNLALQDAFFSPDEITTYGIDSILQGAAVQNAQEIDTMVVDDVRNFLFGAPGAGGFDLVSLNIQRGRDHGLADYNQARVDLGLAAVSSFAEISSDADVQATLESLYGDVNNIDVWVGGLAEDHLPGSSMGELFNAVIADQFERIRDGDRFWYQNVLAGEQLAEIENTTLADVIERNTNVSALQDNVFYDPSVMYFSDSVDRQSADVAVVARGDIIDVIDRTTEDVSSQAADDVSKVLLVGSNRSDDRFTVDVTDGDITPEGGVHVVGDLGRDDTLIVRGAESVVVTDGNVLVDGTSIDYSGIEVLRIQSLSGQVNVNVADGVSMRIVIDDGQGGHHHHRPRDDRRDEPAPQREATLVSGSVLDAANDEDETSSTDLLAPPDQLPLDRLLAFSDEEERHAHDAVFASRGGRGER